MTERRQWWENSDESIFWVKLKEQFVKYWIFFPRTSNADAWVDQSGQHQPKVWQFRQEDTLQNIKGGVKDEYLLD